MSWRTGGRYAGTAAALALTLATLAEAQDTVSQGEGTVQIGTESADWWIPSDGEAGYYAGVQQIGTGVMGQLSIEAYPGPVDGAPLPSVYLRLGIMAPEMRPTLMEVYLSRGPDDLIYLAEDGDLEVARDGDTLRIEFSAAALPLDTMTYEPVQGAEPLPISGSFDVMVPK